LASRAEDISSQLARALMLCFAVTVHLQAAYKNTHLLQARIVGLRLGTRARPHAAAAAATAVIVAGCHQLLHEAV
jgi:hypothetical protein